MKKEMNLHQHQLSKAITVLILSSITIANAFIISPASHRGPTRTVQELQFNSNKKTTSTSTTQLNYGILVPVPDDFFTIAGISLGFAYTITRSWNRVVVENVAWEKRLEDARMQKLDEDYDDNNQDDNGERGNTYTELDLRKMDAEASQSSYGPEAMERRRRGRRSRVRTLDVDDDDKYDDEYDEYDRNRSRRQSSSPSESMTDEQINDFEETYGVAYDPYYDEPYTEDELPDDMSFVEDKVYGDRRYQNGEIFYRDGENKNLYWRQGGRPRLKQFWELF
mmetsp:Transcript_21270/g.31938  ORF Transcript_21270/g.31938 Transcript_21270/m.31938 type:complete len:280 (+) Transcript_21270:255-1094(+)|eukprot:CAMPEP_0203680682 /NCGR_PEP_ID=MMETSP0090-20130426/40238_1 /ASSEMBLY_ACC=CAM_ASM_001088 /TAXON_ID=426623 /ORGANISM="Chaetoceros affinis, Strain CCMP159" /LENGTH=279 /DNA_ID=CAMNT_0050548867 /DNA_START=178 /DNA_END=1017 /DNA_ORIENTATION=+